LKALARCGPRGATVPTFLRSGVVWRRKEFVGEGFESAVALRLAGTLALPLLELDAFGDHGGDVVDGVYFGGEFAVAAGQETVLADLAGDFLAVAEV
jgi:hypothetical protein